MAWRRWLPLLLIPVSLLPDLAAGLPLRTYYFRDFTVAFLPLRLFAARELRGGGFPFWNPYLTEGTFQLPALYPPDLLHVLWPSPLFVSWLLTLHLPLAALAAYWLARELNASRLGGFVAGAVFALGGIAVSTLNLYVFLQALALAPLVAGLLRRAGREGGRQIGWAALALALAVSTLAVEFVMQAVVLGLALGLTERPRGRAALRMGAAVALAAGLAAVPIGVTASLVPETRRGAGLPAELALGYSVHPVVLLQALVPNLLGLLSEPTEKWWGQVFFPSRLPYFLSLYVGPLSVALALAGMRRMERRTRLVLLSLAALGLWYALGEAGGLAALVYRLPFASSFRFPVKALLLPYLAVAIAAAWRGLPLRCAALGTLLFAIALLASASPAWLVSWSEVFPSYWPHVALVVRGDVSFAAGVLGAVAATGWLVRRGRVTPRLGAALAAVLLVGDLVRAGAGVNPQTSRRFFDLLPELAALRLGDLGGGRVFSYGIDSSAAMLHAGERSRSRALTTLYAYRQVVGPYTNLLDRIEAAEAADLTAFMPRGRELGWRDYDPREVAHLLPWFRNAAVARVTSLDPLQDPALRPLAAVPVGPPGLSVYVYAVDGSWPRAYVACRVIRAADAGAALAASYRPGFDGAHDVVLTEPAKAGCTRATATPLGPPRSGRESFEVSSDGPAYLVVRGSWARGWRASVDGVSTPVLRGNGKHRAVAVAAGHHRVEAWYEPPGLRPGLWATGVALVGLAAVLWRGRRRP